MSSAKNPKRKMPRQAKSKQPAPQFKKRKQPVYRPVKGPMLNADLAAYAATMINPLADVRARIPDACNAHTTDVRVVTEFPVVVGAALAVNVVFNPSSLTNHYSVTTATDTFAIPASAAARSAEIIANFSALRIVSAGVFIVPVNTLAEKPGISYCAQIPRNSPYPTATDCRSMRNAGPHALAKGCYFRWAKTDAYDDEFFTTVSGSTNGPQVFFKGEQLTLGSTLSVKLVANYEATVKPASDGFIPTSPSPQYPEQRAAIDSYVATLPRDASVAQMRRGGPTDKSADQVGFLTKIANGVGHAASSFLNFINPVPLIQRGFQAISGALL